MPRTILVIPCYNEERRLQERAFLEFAEQQAEIRLLFVNDGSRDGTLSKLEQLAARYPLGIDVCDLPRNGGKAEAVRQGMLAALTTDAECVGFLDADLATPLEAVPRFVNVLEQFPSIDVVLGTRLPLLGRKIQRNRKRQLLGRLFATVASRTLGVPLQDTQCGAKLFRVTPALRGALSQPFLARWIFDVELLARLQEAPLREAIYEQPLDQWTEVPGSKLKATDFLKAPGELLQIYARYLSPWSAVSDLTSVPLPVMRPFAKPSVKIWRERRSA
jgi:glycosyltransferase involved in cell wall biosynthesis